MFNSDFFNKVAKNVTDSLPSSISGSISGIKTEFEQHFRLGLQSALTQMDLVSREEFDIQCQVLQRTRQKLEELERRIAILENTTS